jgi:hypothetical protein
MPKPFQATVEIQEDVYRYTYGDSEAGPLWCYGSTCIARAGQDLYVSGYQAIEGVPPYNNVRWQLYRRGAEGWELAQEETKERTREPSPLAGFPDGRLFLSVNPTSAPVGERWGPAQPQILRFDARSPGEPPAVLLPEWGDPPPPFSQHSYRALCADGKRGDLLLMNILEHECYHWSLMDRDERWAAHGELVFPWGADYEEPQPIRLCYPEVVLRDRAVHFLGVSDIVEPVRAWREARFRVTQRTWDYDFRRLFYACTPDITTTPFGEWIEVASRESTAGGIRNLDLWVAPNGDAHLLWCEQSCDPRIREWFYPDEPLVFSLEHGVIREGRLVAQDTLARGGEGLPGALPIWGRFHVTPEGRLFVFYAVDNQEIQPGLNALPQPRAVENWLVECRRCAAPESAPGDPVRVPLEQPLGRSFMTATPRAGSPPANELELLGIGSDPDVLRYVRIGISG